MYRMAGSALLVLFLFVRPGYSTLLDTLYCELEIVPVSVVAVEDTTCVTPLVGQRVKIVLPVSEEARLLIEAYQDGCDYAELVVLIDQLAAWHYQYKILPWPDQKSSAADTLWGTRLIEVRLPVNEQAVQRAFEHYESTPVRPQRDRLDGLLNQLLTLRSEQLVEELLQINGYRFLDENPVVGIVILKGRFTLGILPEGTLQAVSLIGLTVRDKSS